MNIKGGGIRNYPDGWLSQSGLVLVEGKREERGKMKWVSMKKS